MTATLTPTAQGFLEFDTSTFASQYNRVPFGFRHQLHRHPLLALPALLTLAKRLPAEKVRLHRADVRIDDDFYNAHATHPVHQGVEETMRNLETVGSYVLIKSPEIDPEYGAFLWPVYEEIGALVDPIDPGRCSQESFIFISSPQAVTPFHLDRLANFHLQIQGEKRIQLWDPFDRSIVSEEDLSHVVAQPAVFRAPYRPEFQARAVNFQQKPGLGVHHPWGAPHAVEVGSEVSVSLAITFRSTEMDRRMALYELNYLLRQRGLRPVPVGQSPWRDRMKLLAYRGFQGVKMVVVRAGRP